MHIISGKYEMSELKKEQNVKYSYFLLLKIVHGLIKFQTSEKRLRYINNSCILYAYLNRLTI